MDDVLKGIHLSQVLEGLRWCYCIFFSINPIKRTKHNLWHSYWRGKPLKMYIKWVKTAFVGANFWLQINTHVVLYRVFTPAMFVCIVFFFFVHNSCPFILLCIHLFIYISTCFVYFTGTMQINIVPVPV